MLAVNKRALTCLAAPITLINYHRQRKAPPGFLSFGCCFFSRILPPCWLFWLNHRAFRPLYILKKESEVYCYGRYFSKI
ncbi:MAG: hypothetical protein ACP6IY_11025 [Promethearchaeia archaeon]